MLGTAIFDGRGCKECPTGFRCPGGVDAADTASNAQPLALPGNIEDSETVYGALRCRSKAACPGERTSCGQYMKGLVCDTCELGRYMGRSMDVCESCGNWRHWLVVALGVTLFAAFLGWVAKRSGAAALAEKSWAVS